MQSKCPTTRVEVKGNLRGVGSYLYMDSREVSVRVSIAVSEHHNQRQPGRERVCFILYFQVTVPH